MSDFGEHSLFLSPEMQADPLDVYRDSIFDIPDPVELLHNEFVETMPRLDPLIRLKAAMHFDSISVDMQDPSQSADLMIHDDPFVRRRVLELYYGKEELSAQDILLRAIAEAPSQGPKEASAFTNVMTEVLAEALDDNPNTTLEGQYAQEVRMIMWNILKEHMPARAPEPTPPADYHPNVLRLYSAIKRPPLIVGEVALSEPEDVHKLMLPELRQPWEEPAQHVIEALKQGKHVLLDSRRNSGKTHIFPGVLCEQAPKSWQVSQITNNRLKGGEGLFGTTAADTFYSSIRRGVDVGIAVASELSFWAVEPSNEPAETETPDRKILILDEIQITVIDEQMRAAGVLDKIVQWAEANGTQLVMISAIGDRRQKDETRAMLDDVLDFKNINIETLFSRPEYPKHALAQILEHCGVKLEVAEWWLNDPVARPLRSMRGLYLMYRALSDVSSYEHIKDYRLRTIKQLGRLMTKGSNTSAQPIRMIDSLAVMCAGSGPDITRLAEHFEISPPNYFYLGFRPGVTPEDII